MKLSEEIINKINDYYTSCKGNAYKHLKNAETYKTLYNYTNTPLIVLSSLTTILASVNGNYPLTQIAIATAVISGLTTILQAISSFYEYNKKY
jgi:hypothetical protein